ncbi:MAG: peroxiredoxin [Proteobacteria bacterium]|nr:peroxiredoxin [Pseudomonadota bacterium]
MASPDVGDRAPDFTLPSTAGPFSLAEKLADGPVLLVFYPGDDTPVCTKQLCSYRDHPEVFAKLGIQVIAINPQGEDSHQRFADKYSLPFPLLTDAGGRVCRAYAALGLLGTAKRALVLVGSDGRIRWRKTDFPLFHQNARDLERVLAELDG